MDQCEKTEEGSTLSQCGYARSRGDGQFYPGPFPAVYTPRSNMTSERLRTIHLVYLSILKLCLSFSPLDTSPKMSNDWKTVSKTPIFSSNRDGKSPGEVGKNWRPCCECRRMHAHVHFSAPDLMASYSIIYSKCVMDSPGKCHRCARLGLECTPRPPRRRRGQR